MCLGHERVKSMREAGGAGVPVGHAEVRLPAVLQEAGLEVLVGRPPLRPVHRGRRALGLRLEPRRRQPHACGTPTVSSASALCISTCNPGCWAPWRSRHKRCVLAGWMRAAPPGL